MKTLNPYLMFPGTCREALTFYGECLDGEIVSIRTFRESPVEVAEEHRDRVFNAEFRAEGLFLRASDDLQTQPVTRGSNFALFVAFSDPDERAQAFQALAVGGKVLFPLEQGFGMVVDRFGIQWMLAQGAE